MTWGNVIDKTNPELVDAKIFDSKEGNIGKLSENTEKAINMQVEASFSSFLNDATVEKKTQKTFNERLDVDVRRVLDLSANAEVGKNTKEAEVKLKTLEFEIELADLQKTILDEPQQQNNIDITVDENEEIKVEDLKIWHIFNWVEKNNIVNSINEITDKKKRNEMSNLLKKWDKESIKTFQLNILNMLKPKDGWGNRLENTWNNIKSTFKWEPLWNGWVDGKFGEKTMSALKDYVAKVNENVVWGPWSYTPNSSEVQNGWNNGVVDWSGKVENNDPNRVEQKENIAAIDYKMQDKYDVKKGDSIVLAQNVIEGNREIYPENKNVIFDKETNKLNYESKNVWEETFKLIIKDKNWKEIKKTMTVNVEENEKDKKTSYERKTAYNKYKNIELGADVKINAAKIDGAMNGLKKDYQELSREVSYLNVISNQCSSGLDEDFNYAFVVAKLRSNLKDDKLKAQLDKPEEVVLIKKLMSKVKAIKSEWNNIQAKLINPKLKEQGEIKDLTADILNKEAGVQLKNFLNEQNPKLITDKLNDNCIYYFDGKFLSEEEFMKDVGKWKIDTSKLNRIGLDVSLVWVSGQEYLESDIWENQRNWEIKKLTLTDDPSISRTWLTRNIDIQYKAEAYGKNMDDDKSSPSKNKGRIRWLLWLWNYDDGLVTNDKNYDVWFETEWLFSKERKKLRNLSNVLLSFSDFNKMKSAFTRAMSVQNEWDIKKMENDKVDKNVIKLGELYLLSKNKEEPMPKLEKSLKFLENKIVRGGSYNNSVDDFWKEIYDEANVWIMKDYIDPDKRRQTVRKLFKWEFFEDWFPEFVHSKELWQLKRIVQNIDLSDFFQWNNRSKWKYKKFDELYTIYSQNKLKWLKDKKWNVVVKWPSWEKWIYTDEDFYYNAVFDYLVWVGEWNQNIVESVNSMKISNNLGNIEAGGNEYWYGDRELDKATWKYKEKDSNLASYDGSEEKIFMLQLADLNSDARADFGDGWLRKWLQIKNSYKDVKVDQLFMPQDWEKPAWQNIIEFAKDYFQKTGKNGLLDDLDKLWGDKEDKITLVELNTEFKTNPWLLNALQEMLVNSPIPLEYIYRYGSNAAEKYLSNPDTNLLENILNNSVEIEWANALLDKEIKSLLAQWLEIEKVPELKSVLKPMFYGALIKNGWVMTGAGGVWLALNTKNAGTFSLNLGYTDMPSGWTGNLWTLWVMMSWWDSWKVSEKTKLNGWVWAGVIWFVPVVSWAVWIKTLMNKSQITNDTLKPKSATYFNMNAHIAIVWGMPMYWAWLWVSMDKMEWINSKYEVIKNQLSWSKWIINQVLENVGSWSVDKGVILAEIEKQIVKSFYEGGFDNIKDRKDKIMLNQAVENIYRGLSYYNLGAENVPVTQEIKSTIVHDMAENYAIQWKNQAVSWTIDDVHIDWFWVWVSLLAGFMPIPYAHVSVWDYKNLYYTETTKSVSDYYAQLATGVGMEHINNEKFYDNNGITSHAVDYLNTKMSIAHPGIDSPDLDAKLSYEATAGKPSFLLGDKPKALCIPIDLCNYTNINISSDMEPYVSVQRRNTAWEIVDKMTPDGGINQKYNASWNVDYIVVPINSKIALLDRSGWNNGKFNLIIGDTKAELDDILINNETNKNDLNGNPAEFAEGMNSQYMDVDKINTDILWMGNIQVWDNVIKNPLISCENDVNGNLEFNLKPSISANCIDMWWLNSKLSIVGDKMKMPQFGTLTMHYEDGKYEMYYSSNPSDKLDISFDVAVSLDESQVIESTVWTEVTGGSLTFNGDIFESVSSDVDTLFGDNIVKELRNLDVWKYWYKFLNDFLNYSSRDLKVDTDTDIDIDEDEYNEASRILVNRFWDKFDDIKTFLENDKISIEKKSLVINRIKWIMAFDANVNKWKYVYQLKDGARKSAYQKLFGPSGDAIWNNLDVYRNIVFENINTKKGDLTRDTESNLFGYTAFYRKGTNEWRNFSMTAPGDTRVLWWEMEEIKDDASKIWFRKNFELNKITQNVVAESIISKLDWIDDGDKKAVSNYIKTHLIKLMESGEDWLDISWGKYKIKLDLGYYFYLLGECANESIWVKLNGIKIEKRKTTPGVDGAPLKIHVDASSTWGLYVNSTEALNQAGASKKSALIGAAFVDNTVPNPTQGTWDIPDPGDWTGDIPDPNDWTWDNPGWDDWTWW